MWASRALRLPRFEALGGNAATPKSIGRRVLSSLLPKTKIEIAVDDALAERVIEAIINTGADRQSRRRQDFVFDLEQVVRIRTGERDASAI